MKLTLDMLDLLPQHRTLPIAYTAFEHLDEKAQAAVLVVGRAMLFNWDRDSYNMIYPPKNEPVPGVWQSMETAPTDGTIVLVSDRLHARRAAYRRLSHYRKNWTGANWIDLQFSDDEGTVTIPDPIAWMPWPKPAIPSGDYVPPPTYGENTKEEHYDE